MLRAALRSHEAMLEEQGTLCCLFSQGLCHSVCQAWTEATLHNHGWPCRSFAELRMVHAALKLYQRRYNIHVIVTFSILFSVMQVCILPGCFFLTILAGSLLQTLPATGLVVALCTFGGIMNYAMSWYLLGNTVAQLWPARVRALQLRISGRTSAPGTAVAGEAAGAERDVAGRQLQSLVLLRLLPAIPACVVNLAAPHAGIGLEVFAASIVLGAAPQVCPCACRWCNADSWCSQSKTHTWQKRLCAATSTR